MTGVRIAGQQHSAITRNMRLLLDLLRTSAERGKPCPNNKEIFRRVGLSPSNIYVNMNKAADLGLLTIERSRDRRRRVVFPDGVGTEWSLETGGAAAPEDAEDVAILEAPGAADMFAGMFETENVRVSPMRCIDFTKRLPPTHVPTQVTGAWA